MHARYRTTINIWNTTEAERLELRPGQWVSAGTPDETRSNCGRFYGVKSGMRGERSVVVAWNGNARRSGSVRQYQQTSYNYAKGV